MRALRVAALAATFTIAAISCAAVTGLGDFDIVECPSGCDGGLPDVVIATPADGGVSVTLPDGAVVIAPDSGVDSGPVDAGSEPLDGAIPIVPDCTVSACPSPLGSECSLEPCTNQTVWTYSLDGGGPNKLDINNGYCHSYAGTGSQRFLSTTLTGAASAHYEIAFRALLQRSGPGMQSPGTIAQIRFGNTVALTLMWTATSFELCTSGNQCSLLAVDSSHDDFRIEIYATAGTALEAGQAVLAIGDPGQSPGTCTIMAEMPLKGPFSGDPSVDIGCIETAQNCDMEFDDAMLSAKSF